MTGIGEIRSGFAGQLAMRELFCLMGKGIIPRFFWDSEIYGPKECTPWIENEEGAALQRTVTQRIQFFSGNGGGYWACITLRGRQKGMRGRGPHVTVETEAWGISMIEICPRIPLAVSANGEGQPNIMVLLNENPILLERMAVGMGIEVGVLEARVCPFQELQLSA